MVNVDNQGAAKGKNKVTGRKQSYVYPYTPWWDAKNRDNLPEELPFDYNEIAHLIPSKGKQVAKPTETKKEEKQVETKPVETSKPVEPVEETIFFHWHNYTSGKFVHYCKLQQ